MNDTMKALRDFAVGKTTIYAISIEPYEHPNPKYDKTGFIFHFHRRTGWSIFGYKNSINNSYYVSGKRANKLITGICTKYKTYPHFYSKNNYTLSVIVNEYAHGHV